MSTTPSASRCPARHRVFGPCDRDTHETGEHEVDYGGLQALPGVMVARWTDEDEARYQAHHAEQWRGKRLVEMAPGSFLVVED